MGAGMTRVLVIDALRMAYFHRRPKAGLMHYSDRGSQYASRDYQEVLEGYGMSVSMRRQGPIGGDKRPDGELLQQHGERAQPISQHDLTRS